MQNRLYSKSVQSVQCYYAALDLKKKKKEKEQGRGRERGRGTGSRRGLQGATHHLPKDPVTNRF